MHTFLNAIVKGSHNSVLMFGYVWQSFALACCVYVFYLNPIV